ncbi:cytosolic carboxypeptidase-like protein 5 isoform X2 [Saccostrea echinata]|uniref:cytosolic carboxypeptidase-like protein 5 isoform X2 n=1 Tax=Saccostrea echinata TaxID=191078 RepID=UPI002A7F9135|nr:cytosolic carboxypeptidase-like protein 5 isoform X2 [Saccostrea echinata]
MSEFRVGGLLFTSKFDSGNLARVEKVSKDEEEEDNVKYYGEPKPDYEFNVWTHPDCHGTEFENGNRSWFYFGIRGWSPNRLIKINIMNLNRQGKLFSQGHCPFTRTVPGKPRWERIRDRPSYENADGQFILTFTYRFLDVKAAITYFAFCYPWSYMEQQERLNEYDKRFSLCKELNTSSPKDSIYYHRELLCHSIDKLRIDLVTVSSCHGISSETEPRFDHNLFPEKDVPRCKKFRGKRVFFLSSRVHPGETPASFVFNGFLEFILKENDPRAKALRRQYIFKFIPILNPDGVQRGHYRTDQRGVNLNRLYLDPSIDLHPSIYGAKSMLVYHHVKNRVVRENDNVNIRINFPGHILTSSPDAPTARKEVVHHDAGDLNNHSKSAVNGAYSAGRDRGVHNGHGDPYSLPPKENSWVSQTSSHDGGLMPPSGRLKIEPLNLGDLDRMDTTLSESRKLMGNDSIHMSSSCSSVLSNVTLKNERKTVDSELRLRLSELNMSDDCRGKMTGLSMMTSVSVGLNDSDIEDLYNNEHLGNEGSEDEGDFVPSFGNNAPHLSDPSLHQIPPSDSGIAFYVDLHGHASKRGCFIYGNYFEDEDTQVDNMLFPKLISMNTAHFDFTGCNFSERNMYAKDKRDGMSKEGSGRVAIHKALGIIHSYTLECNYNTGRMVNPVPPAQGDDGKATPPPVAGFPPKYTQAHYEEVGRALAIAAIDWNESNPWSRIGMSEHNHLNGVKESVRRYIRSMRGGPRIPRNPSKTYLRNNSVSSNNSNKSNFNQNNRLPFSRNNSNDTSSISNNGPGSRFNSGSNNNGPTSRFNSGSTNTGPTSRFNNSTSNGGSASRFNKRDSSANNPPKRELGPVREAARPNLNTQPQQRKRPTPTNYMPIQTSRSTSNQPVTLAMTTADVHTQRQYSADNATKTLDEETLNPLKHVNLLAIAKKPGPPSRIPLPTGQQFMQLSSPTVQELSPPRVPNRSGRYTQRTPQPYPVRKASAEIISLNNDSPLGSHGTSLTSVTPGDLPPTTPGSNHPPAIPTPPAEMNGLDNPNSESAKRRRRYMYMKRRMVNQSPKLGSASNKGQPKTGDTSSETERAKNRRRRRKSLRKVNQSPSSDETGQVNFGTSSTGGGKHGIEGSSLGLSPRVLAISGTQQPQFLRLPRHSSPPQTVIDSNQKTA